MDNELCQWDCLHTSPAECENWHKTEDVCMNIATYNLHSSEDGIWPAKHWIICSDHLEAADGFGYSYEPMNKINCRKTSLHTSVPLAQGIEQ